MSDHHDRIHQRAVIWGFAEEILYKRGIIAYLNEQGWLHPQDATLAAWSSQSLETLYQHLYQALDADHHTQQLIAQHAEHLALVDFLNGYTLARLLTQPWAQGLQARGWRLQALWCPLDWPTGDVERAAALAATMERRWTEWRQTFDLPADALETDWRKQGGPIHADLILWWKTQDQRQDRLVVVEFSSEFHGEYRWDDPFDHLREIATWTRRQRQRGYFSALHTHLTAPLPLPPARDLPQLFDLFFQGDRPLIKLAQAASYAEQLWKILHRYRRLAPEGHLVALSVASSGWESQTVRWSPEGLDARWELLTALAAAYRNYLKRPGEAFAQKERQRAQLLTQGLSILRSFLPPNIAHQFPIALTDQRIPRDHWTLPLSETPAQLPTPDSPLEDTQITTGLGEVPTDWHAYFTQRLAQQPIPSVRAVHAAAVHATLMSHRPGLNLLALEGHPGIGKTTAIRSLLRERSGCLLFYFSPRLAINRDLGSAFARDGILTLRTDSRLIRDTETLHQIAEGQGLLEKGLEPKGTVVWDLQEKETTSLNPPLATVLGDILLLHEPLAEQLRLQGRGQRRDARSRYHPYRRVSDTTVAANAPPVMGVLHCLGVAVRHLTQRLPQLRQLAVTAAIQSYRHHRGLLGTVNSLLRGLDPQFDEKRPPKARERHLPQAIRAWAERFPHWIIMVDELAGDSAGVDLARALYDAFTQLMAYRPDDCPWTVSLVLADASLLHEQILSQYLSQREAPPRIYIAPVGRSGPLTVDHYPVWGLPCWHIKANSFPARSLKLHYELRIWRAQIASEDPVRYEIAYRKWRREVLQKERIKRALTQIQRLQTAGHQQVIYFAQDRGFLQEIGKALKASGQRVELLTSQHRLALTPEILQHTQVFLVTSAGSRGISFPAASAIIAEVPTFHIETQWMEIIQLVYRGRGEIRAPDGQLLLNGDRLDRELVFLLDEVWITDGQETTTEQVRWLEYVWNLLTAALLLRAALLSRMRGEADLGQPLVVVPVGETGTDPLLSGLSYEARALSELVEQIDVFADHYEVKGLCELTQAIKHHLRSFSQAYHLTISDPHPQGRLQPIPIERDRDASLRAFLRFRQEICSPGAPLCLPPGPQPILGETVEVVGPIIRVRRSLAGTIERLLIDRLGGADLKGLRRALWSLGEALIATGQEWAMLGEVQSVLRHFRELLLELERGSEQPLQEIEKYQTAQIVLWTALPVDWWVLFSYHSLEEWQNNPSWTLAMSGESAERVFRDLSYVLGTQEADAPLIARYSYYPFATRFGFGAEHLLARVLDENLIAGTIELNLTNLLLQPSS